MKPNKNLAVEIVGWVGVILILTSYGLNSLGLLDATTPLYPSLNLCGAIGIVISSAYKKDTQPILLNAVWIIIAFIALVRAFY